MSIAESLLSEYDSETENTRKVLAAVPEGQWTWRPHEKSMNLGALASHVAEMPGWGLLVLKQDQLKMEPGEYKPGMPNSRSDLLDVFDKGQVELREELSKTDDETMHRVWTMLWAGQTVMEMPKLSVLRTAVLNHMIHHRGQLTVYLRLLGVPVPGTYGPSADEQGS